MRKFATILLFCCFFVSAIAQKPNRKYGDIKPDDFVPTAYPVDSSANGVVLFDIGSSEYAGNTQGFLSIEFKRHTRIRLLNRSSFDLATISIPLYASSSREESIESLEATTYNIENGKVVSYKLDKSSIFKDRLNKNFTLRKFTLPNLKEGSIIEVKYTFISPYPRDLRYWNFQRSIPVLWSEYTVDIPSFYEFVMIRQGFQKFVVDEGKTRNEVYHIVDRGETASDRLESSNVPSEVVHHTWAMENVPALKEEKYTTTIDNYIAKIDFQLSKVRFPNSPVKDILNNWYLVSEELLKSPEFGEPLTKGNVWLRDDLKKITAGAANGLDSAKKIFEYVRDNMSCTDNTAKYLSNPIKKTYQVKNGNVADINLLLAAMLIQDGFEVHPVMLSTRDNGKAYEEYPVLDRLNYVVCQLKIDDKSYLLDASHSRLGFGMLPSECYNGYARVIDASSPVLVDLSADSIVERKLTTVIVINDEKGGLTGTAKTNYGKYESDNLREKLAKTKEEDFFKEIKKAFPFDIKLTNSKIDSLKIYEEPVTVAYDFRFDTNDDILYLNPVLGEAYKDNPFAAAERLYPVEMPYAMNENYVLMMEIPKGYKVEEVPKSAKVNFNEGEGSFEFLVAKDERSIQLRSTVKLNKANFMPEDYQSLRDFFGYIVKKHSEQIVLKKI